MLAVILTVAAFGVAACGSSNNKGAGGHSSAPSGTAGAATKSYHVAVVADLTGAGSVVGGAVVPGLEAAVDEVNASGQSNINLKTYDGQSTPSGALSAAHEAIAGHPNLIEVSIIGSDQLAIAPTLQLSGIPVITVGSDDANIYPTPKPWYYTADVTAPQIAKGFVQEAKVILGGSLAGKRIAFEGSNSANVVKYYNDIQKFAQAGGATVAPPQLFTTGQQTFSGQAQDIVSFKPDVVIMIESSTQGSVVMSAMNTAGYTGSILMLDSEDSLLSKYGRANLLTLWPYRATMSPTVSSALQAHHLTGVLPYVQDGWTIGYVLNEVFSECGSSCDTAAGLQTAIQHMKPVTPPGNVTYGPVQFTTAVHTLINQVQFYKQSGPGGPLVPAGTPVSVSGATPAG